MSKIHALDRIDTRRITARAAAMFGKPYQELWHARSMARSIGYDLRPDLVACMIDMECLAENELRRQYGDIEDDTDALETLLGW